MHHVGMQSTREILLAKIDAFQAKHDIKDSAFGRMALNDEAFMFRLRGGASVKDKTIDRLHEFMTAYPGRVANQCSRKDRPRARARA